METLIKIFDWIFAKLQKVFDWVLQFLQWWWVDWLRFPETFKHFRIYQVQSDGYKNYYHDFYNKIFITFGVKAVISLVIFFVVLALIMKKTTKSSDALNSWSADVLKKSNKKFVNGIVYGKMPGMFGRWVYSPAEQEWHTGVFAGTGQGKTYTVVRPTLEHWHGRSFVIDISGDIARNVSMPNKIVFDPEKNDVVYSPFAVIDSIEDVDKKTVALENLAYFLIPEIAQDGTSAYYEKTGRFILQACFVAFYFAGIDFCDICKKIKTSTFAQLFNDIKLTKNETALMLISNVSNESPQNLTGAKGQCDRAVDLFATDPAVVRSVHRATGSEIELYPEQIENANIFICVPDNRIAYYSTLLGLITSQMMEYIAGRETNSDSKKILLVLDEFKSLRIGYKMIDEALSKYRKHACRIMILTQSIADLRVAYGRDEAVALVSNMEFKILLGGINDPGSAEYFASLIRKQKVKHETESSSHNDYGQFTHGKTTVEQKERLIEPEELDGGRNTVFVLNSRIKPYGVARLKKVYRLK